jgi:hypothetical protein
MRRIRSPCCARAASGHAAAPPSNVTNARRVLIRPIFLGGQWPEVVRFGHLPIVLILAVIVATGVTLMTFPNAVRKWSGEMSGLMTPLFEAPSRAKTPTKLPRLVLKPPKGFVNEPLPLGVLLSDGSGGEKVILAGVCTENLVRFDLMAESLNVGHDGLKWTP